MLTENEKNLFKAIESDDLAAFTAALAAGASPLCQNEEVGDKEFPYRVSPLLHAIHKYKLNFVAKMLEIDVVKEKLRKSLNFEVKSLLEYTIFRGDLSVAKSLLALCPQYASFAFDLCLKKNQSDYVNELFSIPHIQDNLDMESLNLAIDYDRIDLVKTLISHENIKSQFAIWAPRILQSVIDKGNGDIFDIFLNISDFKNLLDRKYDDFFRGAALVGHANIVKKLLAIGKPSNPLPLINEAISNGFVEIALELLSIPTIKNKIDFSGLLLAARRGQWKVAAKIIEFNPLNHADFLNKLLHEDTKNMTKDLKKKLLSFVVDQMKYFDVFWLGNFINPEGINLTEEVKCLLNEPFSFIENKPWKLYQKQAMHILLSRCEIIKYKDSIRQFMQNDNADNAQAIARVQKHFQQVIEPAFSERFNSYGASLDERIINIEKEIRLKILQHMLNEIEEDSKKPTPINSSYLKLQNFILENQDTLCSAQDSALMLEFRELLKRAPLFAAPAWRCYDATAPCDPKWPNLLTHQESTATVFSMREAHVGELKASVASDLARQMVAYSYLLVTDPISDIEIAKYRINNFISQLNDMRRAHNVKSSDTVDSPTCFPGLMRRAGLMWNDHPLQLKKRDLELLLDVLSQILHRHFTKRLKEITSPEQKEDLYQSLVLLAEENATQVLEDENPVFNEALANIRQDFINSLPPLGVILDEISQKFSELKLPTLTQSECIYVIHYLFRDPGGRWNAYKLSSVLHSWSDAWIDMEESKPMLKNPFRSGSVKFSIFEKLLPIIKEMDLPIEVQQNLLEAIAFWDKELCFGIFSNEMSQIAALSDEALNHLFQALQPELRGNLPQPIITSNIYKDEAAESPLKDEETELLLKMNGLNLLLK